MRYRARGVTLLELMITVAVVAILAGIAYPSYRAQILRSNRSEARTALMQASQTLERCYTHSRTYAGCASVSKGATTTGKYMLSWEDVNMTATGFTITATTQGAQAQDTDCTTFEMTAVGRTARRSDGTANTACW
jgi:type IV pilus assembly protein PilE